MSSECRPYIFTLLKKREQHPIYQHMTWHHLAGKQRAQQIEHTMIEKGRKILERLNTTRKPTYTVPGNWDQARGATVAWESQRVPKRSPEKFAPLIKKYSYIHNIHKKSLRFKDITLIGWGLTSCPELPVSKNRKNQFTKEELRWIHKNYKHMTRRLHTLFKTAQKKKQPTIFISHNSPYNTPLDRINNKHSPAHGEHYGSIIAREMIEKYQPLACISGHIHEGEGHCKIGKTLCINSGFGREKNILLTIENNKVKMKCL